jgi:hypothetical protein
LLTMGMFYVLRGQSSCKDGLNCMTIKC